MKFLWSNFANYILDNTLEFILDKKLKTFVFIFFKIFSKVILHLIVAFQQYQFYYFFFKCSKSYKDSRNYCNEYKNCPLVLFSKILWKALCWDWNFLGRNTTYWTVLANISRNTRARCGIGSKFTIKHQKIAIERRPVIFFVVNFFAYSWLVIVF